MINVSDVTRTIVKILTESPTLLDVKSVERGEYVNMDSARSPWIGVYRTEIAYAPHTLGSHSRSWLATLTIKMIVQVHDADGLKAEDALEELIQRIMSVLLEDLTLREYVQMLNSMRVQYSYDETDSSTMDYQWAFITLIYEARTGI